MLVAKATIQTSAKVGKLLRFVLDVEGHTMNYDCAIGATDEDAQQFAYHKLARLMQACGVATMRDSDELNGYQLHVLVEGDEIKDALPLEVEAKVVRVPAWKRLARWAWLDFVRAPISGSAILTGHSAAGMLLWSGQVDRAMLCLILAQLWIIQRGPFNG